MRVLVYTENYEVGGCDRYIADLAGALEPQRAQLVFAGNSNPAFDDYLQRRVPAVLPRATLNIASMRDPLAAKVWRALWRAPVGPVEGGPEGPSSFEPQSRALTTLLAALRYRQNATNLVRLRRLLRAIAPDVVHINNGGYPGGESCRMAALAAHAERIPAVHFVHNMAYPPAAPQRLERALDARIDRATAVWATAAVRASDHLHRMRAIPRDHVATVHYGIGDDPIGDDVAVPDVLEGEQRPVVIVVASFEPRKGHDILLRALAERRDAGRPAVRTLLLGEGALRDSVERETERLGLAGDVDFLGWRNDVPALLRHGTMLVLPSTGQECLPYAILEAMVAGLPVVSTDVAGIPEMVEDGRTGRVVAPRDPHGLAVAIDDVLGRGSEMGEAGRARVRSEFSLERMLDATYALWQRALATAAART